jgi:hypothetical protein
MLSSTAARRLLALCFLIPLPELSQDEVDYLFWRAVEDAPADGLSVAPDGIPDSTGT